MCWLITIHMQRHRQSCVALAGAKQVFRVSTIETDQVRFNDENQS